MPYPKKSMAIDLERLDEQLLNVHVQLSKLDLLVSGAARNREAGGIPTWWNASVATGTTWWNRRGSSRSGSARFG